MELGGRCADTLCRAAVRRATHLVLTVSPRRHVVVSRGKRKPRRAERLRKPMATEPQNFTTLTTTTWRQRVEQEQTAAERAKSVHLNEAQRDPSPELRAAGTRFEDSNKARALLQEKLISHQLNNKFYNRHNPALP